MSLFMRDFGCALDRTAHFNAGQEQEAIINAFHCRECVNGLCIIVEATGLGRAIIADRFDCVGRGHDALPCFDAPIIARNEEYPSPYRSIVNDLELLEDTGSNAEFDGSLIEVATGVRKYDLVRTPYVKFDRVVTGVVQ